MTKSEFVAALWKELDRLPAKEAARYIDYYVEMLDDRIEEGMTEEQAVDSLEPVEAIAGQILAEDPSEAAPARRRLSVTVIVLLCLGSPVCLSLAIALLAVALAVCAVVWALVFSFWTVALSLIAGGVFAAAAGPFQAVSQGAAGWYTMGSGLILAGVGLMLIGPSARFARLIARTAGRFAGRIFRKGSPGRCRT